MTGVIPAGSSVAQSPALAGVVLPNGRRVREIADRLSLRAPQREALERLDVLLGAGLPPKNADEEALAGWAAQVSERLPAGHSFADFEREFVSLAFALATGVGKTRLMGAMVAYLHLVHGVNNFFVLAPNLTIYNKLIGDFQANNPKYVLRGLQAFQIDPPVIVTGDNYEAAETNGSRLFGKVVINVFNVSKINSEVRGGREPRIRKPHENLEMGRSYFEYLQNLPDLVMLMDESHRYRASAGVRAINELQPRLGLELTATPFVESTRGPVAFRNVVMDYTLARAIADGFVKVPAVVTREDFHPERFSPEALEQLKLEDGVRLHENVKAELVAYALESGAGRVKPFMLVIARDTAHAAALLKLIESEAFFGGRYAGRAIQVDHTSEDLMIERLLRVEHADEPTEIVIHVNMLKEGWDVTNLYTIVPLRAANARTLIEQSIGRGLRLPFGGRVNRRITDPEGNRLRDPLDRLSIVAHDRFQEIVDEANRADSPVRLMERVLLSREGQVQATQTVVSNPGILGALGITTPTTEGTPGADGTAAGTGSGSASTPVFTTPQTQQIAQATYQAAQLLSREVARVPNAEALLKPEVQAALVQAVETQLAQQASTQPTLLEAPTQTTQPPVDVAAVVRQATEQIVGQTISIPRITVTPVGEAHTVFQPFTLDLSGVRLQPGSKTLIVQALNDNSRERLGLQNYEGIVDQRVQDSVVSVLMDNPEVSYEQNADILYDLAEQVVAHFHAQDFSDADIREILATYRRTLSNLLFQQMREHQHIPEVTYTREVRQGFTALRPSTLSIGRGGIITNPAQTPPTGARIETCLYRGFTRSLYPDVKFHSDPERRLALILDRESRKWFRPVLGQFQIYYHFDHQSHQYQPDFVAETPDELLLLEVKARDEINTPSVQAKARAALEWCQEATRHTQQSGGKSWQYAILAAEDITAASTLKGLLNQAVASA